MKLLLDITLEDIQAVMAKKGYVMFDNGHPNLVGIRNTDHKNTNAFNDRCFAWWNDSGVKTMHNYTITTHPGFYYLQHPIAGSHGTAILVPGQYKDCWVLGMHRGKQFALCQRSGEVSVYRDSNEDTVLNCNPTTITKGYFGIDLHNAGLSNPEQVGPWSAGCQVWEFNAPHEALMQSLQTLANKYHFSNFTYTLLEQEDFIA